MENEILFKILQLDSLINFLDWTERVRIHLYMENKMKSSTPKILAAHEWIINNDWQPPRMKYGDDYLQYFYDVDSDTWMMTEYYLELFAEYQTELNQLKI